MTSLLAECADPTTPPKRLSAIHETPTLSPTERGTLARNPNLPPQDLFECLYDGHGTALFNPALPLLLLTHGAESMVHPDSDNMTLRDAVVWCLWEHVARLCEYAPRDPGLDVLRQWVAGVGLGAYSWWKDPSSVAQYVGRDDKAWEHVTAHNSFWLGEDAVALVCGMCKLLLGRDEWQVPVILRLASEMRALDMLNPVATDAAASLLAFIDRATELLGHPRPLPAADPRQLSLFSEVA